jgi:N-acetylneuraminic acid mutarotase
LGGDDGSQVSIPPAAHTGFRRDILGYNIVADRWTAQGRLPFSLVTTPAVEWHSRIVIPGGESRPGVRSTEVWWMPTGQTNN